MLGHVPAVAIAAHLHVVFPPLDELSCQAAERELGRVIPSPYKAFLKEINGVTLFVGSLVLLGHVIDSGVSPRSLLIPNVAERPIALASNWVIVGSFGYDASHLVMSEQTGAEVRWVSRDGVEVRRSWSSVDALLQGEIQRLSRLLGPRYEDLSPRNPTDSLPPFEASRKEKGDPSHERPQAPARHKRKK